MNLVWSQLIIEELVRNQVNLFCISPGHRSAPLVAAGAMSKKAICKAFIDERAAAYYAVGYSKNHVKNLTALICTSGTALANYFPAVIESFYSNIPLVILSGDRPPELREASSNQTIDQLKIFHKYCCFFADLPCPQDPMEALPLEYILTTIDDAIGRAKYHKAPVHINCMFREPFLDEYNTLLESHKDILPGRWLLNEEPYTRKIFPSFIPNDASINTVAEYISNSTAGFIIVGNIDQQKDTPAIRKIASKMKWPVHSDALSGMKDHEYSISHLDSMIKKSPILVDTVIFFGDRIISKDMFSFLEKNNNLHYIKVMDKNIRSDVTHNVSLQILTDISAFCNELEKKLYQIQYKAPIQLLRWAMQKEAKIKEVIRNEISKSNKNKINSFSAVTHLIHKRSQKFGLFGANSMSIRLINDFTKTSHQIMANRGASGIDGNIASALGYSYSIKKPVLLLIGDLALMHDLNSLYLLKKAEYPLLIILLNDRGGGIFSMLSVSKLKSYKNIFEDFFIVPQQVKFQHISASFDIAYHAVSSLKELKNIFLKIIQYSDQKKSCLVEIKIDQKENSTFLKRLYKKIKSI